MTEFQCHWSPSGNELARIPSVRLEAESQLQGAALALRHFAELGCDLNAPLAHVDLTEPGGFKHSLLVEEVFDWLNDPRQSDFSHREGLSGLRH